MGRFKQTRRAVSTAVATLWIALVWPGIPAFSQSPPPEQTPLPEQTTTGASEPDAPIQLVPRLKEKQRLAPENKVTTLNMNRSDIEHWSGTYLNQSTSRSQIVGAGLAVFTMDGPIVMKGFGHGNFDSLETMHPDITYLPLGDFGNRFLAEALFNLERDNRLLLSQPAEMFLTRLSLPPEYRHLRIQDLFTRDTGLTASVRGTETKREKSAKQDLGHVKAMLTRSSKEAPDYPTASALASALAGLILEDVSGTSLQEGLRATLSSAGINEPFLNAPSAALPKYTSLQHHISKYGAVEARPVLASANGFLATNGIYVTLSDLISVLSTDLKGLAKQQDLQKFLSSILFEKSRLQVQDRSYLVYVNQSRLDASTLDIRLIPELNVGIVGFVNSSAKEPDMAVASGREIVDPPIGASDIVDNLLQYMMQNQSKGAKPDIVSASIGPDAIALEGSYIRNPQPFLGPDRLIDALAPKVRVRAEPGKGLIVDGDGMFENLAGTELSYHNPINGRTVEFDRPSPSDAPMMYLAGQSLQRVDQGPITLWGMVFWISIVLQFAVIASIRWPATSSGARLAKASGLAGILAMSTAFLLPAVLILQGHSRTLADGLYQMSSWAFPIASLLAITTAFMCIAAWRGKYWSEEGYGFTRRLCFTIGTLGLIGLTLAAHQWGLTTLPMI